MASNFPIYRAPSIPKLSKRNISSSVFNSAFKISAPKLKATKFSFIKPAIMQNAGSILKPESEKSISESLTETNRILVEIQKQLALDFASRIVEEKENLKKIRAEESKKRFLSKENAIEKIKSIGSGIYNQVDKILGPTKSIFQKIIEFFKIILTGMVVNTAFIWLSKKENREKLKAFFKFLIDHWKWIVGTLLTIKLLGVLYKIYKVAKLFKKFIDFFSKKPPGGGDCGCDDKKPKGGGPYDPCAPVLNCIKDINGPTAEALAERIADTSKFKPLFALLGVTRLRPKPKPRFTTPTNLPPGVLEDMQKGGKTASPLGDIAITGIIAAAIEVIGPLIAGLIGGGGEIAAGAESLDAINKIVRFSRIASPIARSRGGTIPKFSAGGTVGGRGSGNVDSVRANLAPGEEVIRSQSANIFRPLLKDINDNAGRLWEKFARGVTKTETLNQEQEDNSKKLNKTLKDFNDLTESIINKSKRGVKNINPQKPTTPTTPSRKPNPSAFTSNKNSSNRSNTLLTSYTRPKSSITSVNLPPTPLNKPQVTTPTRTATKAPNISSTNPLNPWHKQSLRLMGVYMEGGVLA